MKFINREAELNFLEKEYVSNNSSFIIIWGRRRVGKTELLKTFSRKKPAIFYIADLTDRIYQINSFKELVADFFKDSVFRESRFESFEPIFRYISQKTKQKTLLIIDEYPYLRIVDPSIDSVLQKAWDMYLKNKKIMIILSGSHISMMEKIINSYTHPLYGRRTGQLKISPFKFLDFIKFFHQRDYKNLLRFYGVFGGTPRYILEIDIKKTLWENIKEKLLNPMSSLYMEPQIILPEEIRSPFGYFTIMKSIGEGKVKLSEISSSMHADPRIVSKYLSSLQEMDLIERRIPVTAQKSKSRKGIYLIKDYFFRFWFRYIFGNSHLIETGKSGEVLNFIKKDFDTYMGKIFEEVILQIINQKPHLIPFKFKKAGSFWDRKLEIDIVLIGDNEVLLGECKYSKKPVDQKDFKKLLEKSKSFPLKNKKIYYALFSLSDFSPELTRTRPPEASVIQI